MDRAGVTIVSGQVPAQTWTELERRADYTQPAAAAVHGKQAHKVIVNGHPPAGTTKMGFKGPGGRPADRPFKLGTPNPAASE